MKKALLASLAVIVVLFAGAFLWARSVLTGENVRTAVAAQVEKALGQPVSIGSISATIMPRVTMTLGNVKIGRPERIVVNELHVGTDFRALLSRRIEHASVRLTGARIDLPLPAFAIGTTQPAASQEAASTPVELVSIDEIILSNVQVSSGGRTLRGDIEVVPEGKGLVVRRIALGADKTSINITGKISDLAGPVGELQIAAGALDVDQLLSFVNDFTAGTGFANAEKAPEQAPASSAPPSNMKMTLALAAESATMNGLVLSKLNGKAVVADGGLKLDPVSFQIFGGTYQGSLSLNQTKNSLQFRGTSTLSQIDVAAATLFAGSGGTVTGSMSGRLDFAGSGASAPAVIKTVRGKARVDIVDGVVKNLGLINSIVVATSMRSGSLGQATSSATSGSRDEPFTRLGATLEMANGSISTNDLRFEAKDVVLNASGVIDLAASMLNLKGQVQLSDALSEQAGRDLVRYTQQQGRVTLPATVTGSIDAPSVRIDAADMAKRALKNAANEQKQRAAQEATKAVQKKLGGLFGR